MKVANCILLLTIVVFYGCKAKLEDLEYETNFLKGLELAEELRKPVFVHFTGYGSGGYNEFRECLAISKRIQEKLNNDFVTIQLYVDDHTKLQKRDTLGLYKIPFSKQVQKRIRKLRTIGNLNVALQIELLQANTQPHYVIMDSQRNLIETPFGYTKNDKSFFLRKLNEGLHSYNDSDKTYE